MKAKMKTNNVNQSELTQAELKRRLHYDPLTGLFVRLICENNSMKVGSIAGSNKWRYVRIKINDVSYYAHRLAWLYMTGEWPKEHIDHIDRNKHNNKFSNLREADSSLNNRNINPRKNNTTGYVGVTKTGNGYYSKCMIKGTLYQFGRSETALLAHEKREKFIKDFNEQK